jgi:hypothetical protein
MDDDTGPTRPQQRPARAERLAAALRANLKRRKAQARGRDEATVGRDADPSAEGARPTRPDAADS